MRILFIRQQDKGRKREPQTLEELVDLDDDYRLTKSGQPFLLKEVSEGKDVFFLII